MHPYGLHENPQFVLKPFGHPKRDHIEPTLTHNPHTTNTSRPVAGRLPALDCGPQSVRTDWPTIQFRLQHWPPFIAHRFTHTLTLCGFYAWSTNEHRSSQRHVRASAIQLSRVPGDRRRRICTPPAKQTTPRSVGWSHAVRVRVRTIVHETALARRATNRDGRSSSLMSRSIVRVYL